MTKTRATHDPTDVQRKKNSVQQRTWAHSRKTTVGVGMGTHYENMPIQIYRKFHLQKLKIFR